MPEGPPGHPGRTPLPHILVPWAASEHACRGRGGGAGKPIRQIGNHLLVSLRTDAAATDIYTPIATQIGIPIAITT